MKQTILFLCPHNAAKSVIAAAYFNHFAAEKDLSFIGDSAGTEPSEKVSSVVVAMMKEEGLDVSQFKPRLVMPEEFQTAARIISIGCTPEELNGAGEVDYWDDVPMVSQNPEGSRNAIRAHVKQLVADLVTAE